MAEICMLSMLLIQCEGPESNNSRSRKYKQMYCMKEYFITGILRFNCVFEGRIEQFDPCFYAYFNENIHFK